MLQATVISCREDQCPVTSYCDQVGRINALLQATVISCREDQCPVTSYCDQVGRINALLQATVTSVGRINALLPPIDTASLDNHIPQSFLQSPSNST